MRRLCRSPVRVVGVDPNGTQASNTSDSIAFESRTVYDNAGNVVLTEIWRLIDPVTVTGATALYHGKN
jgi:hypothetical protein